MVQNCPARIQTCTHIVLIPQVVMLAQWLSSFSWPVALTLVVLSCYLCYRLLLSLLWRYNKHLIEDSPQFSLALLKAAGLQKFGQYLGILQQIIGEITRQDGIIQFGYVVPDHLCHNHPSKETGGVYLDLGAILALTDEITTVVLMCEDKTHRPGVSVTLSGELFCHEIRPGQNILIEACATKIGSTLAFTEVCVCLLCLFVCLSVYLSVCLCVCLCMLVCVACLSFSLSISLLSLVSYLLSSTLLLSGRSISSP
jgi:hypothetical protein